MLTALCCAAFFLTGAVGDVDDEGKGKGKGDGAVVDLNTASATELCTLPGIGPKKAEAILALRQKKPFTRITQLLQVKGIGPKTLEKLKPRLRLTAPKPTPTPTPTPTATTSTATPTLAPLLSTG